MPSRVSGYKHSISRVRHDGVSFQHVRVLHIDVLRPQTSWVFDLDLIVSVLKTQTGLYWELDLL